ncbi:hypothetical protein G6F42_011689 [Rhizopus arrhizus]|nr:hypothetical protein G6F42_011689 [Rhizopus arrhizus]
MDKVLNDIVDEVALEGDQGCTVDEFFTLVETLLMKALEDTQLNTPILFDDGYKSYLWQQIKDSTQLLFIENGKSINPNDLTYDQLKSKGISITTTEQVLERNIYGNLKDLKKNLNEKQRHILSSIAKSRHQGISQYELGEIFKMDPKAIFYHVKKLNQLGLIKANNQDSKEEQSDGVIYRLPVFKEKITKLLKQETGHLMPISDLLDALSLGNMTERKWARVRIQEMHNQGEIEKFNATDGNKLRQCVRLVSSPTTTPTLTTSNLLQQDSIHSSQHFSIDRDLPCDYLFYKDVEAAAEKGMTRQDLIDKYPFIDPVQFKLFFESATIPPKSADLMPYLLHRTEEVFGKNRQFRYYTQTGWNKFNEANGNQITEPTLTIAPKPTEPEILKEPTSIDEISLVLKGPVRKRPHRINQATKETAKKRRTVAESTPKSTPPADTPPANKGADMESVSQIPSKRPNDDNQMPLSISSLKKRKKDSLRNNTKTRRYGIILDMVEKVHIREFNTNMMNEFKSIELQSPGGQSMARQTFDTLVQELHDQQKLRIYVTAIKKPNGLTDIRKFVLHASLNADSPQVKDFIDHYHLQKPIMDGPSGRKEIKVVNMPVLPSSSKDSGAGKSSEPIAGNSNSWRVNAIENGWISSKWIRAKAFMACCLTTTLLWMHSLL